MTDATTPTTKKEKKTKAAKAKQATKPEKTRVCIYPEVGDALFKTRKECGMTQQQLADATGVSRITIQRIEQAHINPSFKTLESLARGMGRKLTISFDK